MKIDAVDFASLLCGRLCHDLLSPVSALSNGLELLTQETDAELRRQCLNLLADSIRATANKLMFFRLPFGGAGGPEEPLDSALVRDAVQGLFPPNRPIQVG